MEDSFIDIDAFAAGDLHAFESLYNRFVGKTYNYLLSFTHDAELSKDLTQSTFLQLWNSRSNLDATRNIDGYIFMIARNLLYREIRSRAVINRYEEFVRTNSDERDTFTIDEKMTKEAIENRITELLQLLPEARRRIFMLRWNEGLSNKEIAASLQISEKTVSTQINRTVTFLRAKMGLTFAVLLIINSFHF